VVESFWAVPDVATMRTPLTILREQATALTEQTNGLIVGRVEAKQQQNGNLSISLEAVVPALNEYSIRILNYEQPITLYPGDVRGIGISVFETVENEEDFIIVVREVLSSQTIKNILTSLMSQVGEMSLNR
jgi:hypothetical protein